ncbi:F-box protein CPR1-like [Silene latifolia]|uniref:F-box protein CPR1-like n=1 Tax=Silene latifolia TaxID=37657 RepID=UPI003D77E430
MSSKWNWRPFVACCESYLLIRYSDTNPWTKGLILVNPITRIYRILPTAYHDSISLYEYERIVRYGMCHCLNDDFKVVMFVLYEGSQRNRPREIEVYSLRTNLWRCIECETTTGQRIGDPVLVQNHLLVMFFFDNYHRLTGIGCFDVKAERWSNDVLLPDTILAGIDSNPIYEGQYYNLGLLDGKLCFSWYDENKATYTTWVMKNYGVKASWVKLMSVLVKGPEEIFNPIAYRKGWSHELLCVTDFSGKCFWFNFRDKQFTETEFDSDGLDTNYLCYAWICKGSLLNFPGGQPIHSVSNE